LEESVKILQGAANLFMRIGIIASLEISGEFYFKGLGLYRQNFHSPSLFKL
jgi:hypothetical protein